MDFTAGDRVRATWSDGYVVVGKYKQKERGFVILISEDDESQVACGPAVTLELLENKDED